jgi:hypothetical protein
MDILPVNNSARTVDHARQDAREQPRKKQQPRKKEAFVSRPVYTPYGRIEEDQPPKIDVLV